jgi:hypothetical protein
MTRALILFTCLLAVTARGSTAELTQDDYDIWHAAIRGHDPRRVVYVWHVVDPLEALQRTTLETALKDFPEARPTADTWQGAPVELDLRQLDAAASRVTQPFGRGTPYAVLGSATLGELVGTTPKPNWILNPAVLPDAEAVCRLTRPVIRADGRVAYLLYLISTEWWGALMSCTLHRDPTDGTWRVDTCRRMDFTDWKDGKRLLEGEKVAEPCSCH